MKSYVLNRFACSLPRGNTLQPLSSIVPPPQRPETLRTPQALEPTATAASTPVAARRPQRSAHLCGHLRSYMLVLLTSQQSFLTHPLGPSHGPVVNLTYRKMCAQAVVLLERLDPEIMRRMSKRTYGEPPPWTPQLLLMVVFRLMIRIADEGGNLHHRDAYMRLRNSVVISSQADFDKGAFMRRQELRFLKDINFATYVVPELIDATLERINQWLSASPQTLRKKVFAHPDACVIGPLLADFLGRESRIMQLAIDERDRCQRVSSPQSPALPTTPTTPRFRAVPELEALLTRRQVKSAQKSTGYFDPLPPSMPHEVLTDAEDLGWSYGTR